MGLFRHVILLTSSFGARFYPDIRKDPPPLPNTVLFGHSKSDRSPFIKYNKIYQYTILFAVHLHLVWMKNPNAKRYLCYIILWKL